MPKDDLFVIVFALLVLMAVVGFLKTPHKSISRLCQMEIYVLLIIPTIIFVMKSEEQDFLVIAFMALTVFVYTALFQTVQFRLVTLYLLKRSHKQAFFMYVVHNTIWIVIFVSISIFLSVEWKSTVAAILWGGFIGIARYIEFRDLSFEESLLQKGAD